MAVLRAQSYEIQESDWIFDRDLREQELDGHSDLGCVGNFDKSGSLDLRQTSGHNAGKAGIMSCRPYCAVHSARARASPGLCLRGAASMFTCTMFGRMDST